jgi:hypothetical protein
MRNATLQRVSCAIPSNNLDSSHIHESLRVAVYIATVAVLFPLLAMVYLHACSGRATHSVPTYTGQSITEPFECRPDGSFDSCAKDDCNMITATCAGSRWERFEVESVLSSVDTLSSQLGNCVTTRRLKTFPALLS